MSVSAVVKDGQLIESASQAASASADTKATSSQKSGYDKDAFMQILVAQMKYQDPLEPTSNTEYISQYATFSQVEQLENMASTMELSRSSAYVGQTVQITASDSKGEDTIIEGVVDFIKYEGGKAFLSIGGDLYPAENVTAVIDSTYNDAYQLAEAFAKSMNSLPSIANLTLADKDTIETLRSGYNALTPYQQSFIDSSYTDLLKEYVAAMDKMISDSENSNKAAEEKAEEAKAEAGEAKAAEAEKKSEASSDAGAASAERMAAEAAATDSAEKAVAGEEAIDNTKASDKDMEEAIDKLFTDLDTE